MRRILGNILAVFLLAAPQLNVSQPSPVNVSQVGGTAIAQLSGASEHLIIPTTNSAVGLTATVKATLTTAVVVKASAGNLYGVLATNGAASVCWVQFLNTASSPALGTNVVFAVPLPVSGVVAAPPGALSMSNFSTGISIGISTTATGSSACGTAGNVTVFYD